MDSSICRFIPAKTSSGNLSVLHFVYETELATLRQPFLHPIYYLHLATGGSAVLKMGGKSYPLRRGDLFFMFPGYPCEIVQDTGLVYIYISFTGSYATDILKALDVTPNEPVYHGYDDLLDFWKSAIVRVNALNAGLLSESVLLYTLSFLGGGTDRTSPKSSSETLFDLIVDYVEQHYRDQDMSLKKLSGIFPYTEKYISSLFSQKMNVRFSSYLNGLRLRYARQLMDEGHTSVSQIANLCGYSDSLYFSKVFKKSTGMSPSRYSARLSGGAKASSEA